MPAQRVGKKSKGKRHAPYSGGKSGKSSKVTAATRAPVTSRDRSVISGESTSPSPVAMSSQMSKSRCDPKRGKASTSTEIPPTSHGSDSGMSHSNSPEQPGGVSPSAHSGSSTSPSDATAFETVYSMGDTSENLYEVLTSGPGCTWVRRPTYRRAIDMLRPTPLDGQEQGQEAAPSAPLGEANPLRQILYRVISRAKWEKQKQLRVARTQPRPGKLVGAGQDIVAGSQVEGIGDHDPFLTDLTECYQTALNTLKIDEEVMERLTNELCEARRENKSLQEENAALQAKLQRLSSLNRPIDPTYKEHTLVEQQQSAEASTSRRHANEASGSSSSWRRATESVEDLGTADGSFSPASTISREAEEHRSQSPEWPGGRGAQEESKSYPAPGANHTVPTQAGPTAEAIPVGATVPLQAHPGPNRVAPFLETNVEARTTEIPTEHPTAHAAPAEAMAGPGSEYPVGDPFAFSPAFDPNVVWQSGFPHPQAAGGVVPVGSIPIPPPLALVPNLPHYEPDFVTGPPTPDSSADGSSSPPDFTPNWFLMPASGSTPNADIHMSAEELRLEWHPWDRGVVMMPGPNPAIPFVAPEPQPEPAVEFPFDALINMDCCGSPCGE